MRYIALGRPEALPADFLTLILTPGFPSKIVRLPSTINNIIVMLAIRQCVVLF